MISIESKKKIQRFSSLKKREFLQKNNLNAQYKLPKQISNIKSFKTAQIVASFISIRTEISLNILNRFLAISQKIMCLPVIKEDFNYLIFREFNKNTILKKGKFDIPEPIDSSRELLPDLVLVPCLAFDKFGYRIGYGGGYYDRTFARFKDISHSFVSVAVAYEDQRVDNVVYDKYDKKIDYIMTEKSVYQIK